MVESPPPPPEPSTWLKVKVEFESRHTQSVSMRQVRLFLKSVCQRLSGSARIPSHSNFFSKRYVLLLSTPLNAPNSTKKPFRLKSNSDKTNRSCRHWDLESRNDLSSCAVCLSGSSKSNSMSSLAL